MFLASKENVKLESLQWVGNKILFIVFLLRGLIPIMIASFLMALISGIL